MRTNTKSFAATMIVMVLLVVGLLVLWWFQAKQLGDWPHEAERTSLKAKKATLERSIAGLEVRLEIRPILEELEPILREEDRMARQVLPSNFFDHELSEAIAEKAKQTGVMTQSVRRTGGSGRRNTTDNGNFETIGFEINLQGTFDQIAMFINSMEEFERSGPDTEGLRRFFKVTNLEITSSKRGLSLTDSHVGRLSMATFRYSGDS